MTERVETIFTVSGTERVTSAFREIGEASARAGKTVSQSTEEMNLEFRVFSLQLTGLIGTTMSFTNTLQRLAAGQMDALSGTLSFALGLLRLTTAIWGVVGAENARAIAHGIANALAGPTGWAIIAGATAFAAAAYALTAQIPRTAGVYTKASPIRFLSGPLAGQTVREQASITFNIYGGEPYAVAGAVVDALKRRGVV